LPLVFSLLSLGACNTQQLGPDNAVIGEDRPGAGQGELQLFYASTAASYQEEQTLTTLPSWNPPVYNVTMDGRLLAQEEGVAGSSVAQVLPISISEEAMAGIGYLDTGVHHFAVLVPGHPPIFQGDGELMAGAWLRLYLFGAADAPQGRFVITPDAPSPGNEHITVINLMRSGQAIEVVSCTDATTCTPISPPLAKGEFFQTEAPAIVSDDGYASLAATGAGIGYRLVPSAPLPNPAVNALYTGVQGAAYRPAGSNVPVPIFMSDQGVWLHGFN